MIARWFRRRDVACRQAIELMSDYLDGRLAEPDRVKLERHLDECPHCVEYLAQLRLTITAVGRVEPSDLADDALTELVELYRRCQR